MNEQRFALSYRESADDSGDAPGLVLGDDGVVYAVLAGGTREAWGAGAGGKLDPYTTIVGNDATLAIGTSSIAFGDGGVRIEETTQAGIVLDQYNGAAFLKIGSVTSAPDVDLFSSTVMKVHANEVVEILGNGGNAKLFVGVNAGDGGNNGVLIEVPSSAGATTFELDVGATDVIHATDSNLFLNHGQVNIQGSGVTGIIVTSGGGNPVVQLVDSATGFLGFFGTTAVARISGATLTTVPQLVSALQSYGLLGP